MPRNRSTVIAAIAAPALALFLLTACSTPGSGDGTGATTEPGASSAPEGTDASGCAPGHVWSADVDDMAVQLKDKLIEQGSDIESTTGEGSQVLTWGADGAIDIQTDYTFTVVSNLSDGLVMTITQRHHGPSTGTLTIEGDTAVPSDFDNSGYTVDNTIDINGTSADAAFPIPETGWTDAVNLTIVSCDDTTLKTFAQGGFVTQTWSRQD